MSKINEKDLIANVLYKKAIGFVAKEVVEEYGVGEKKKELIKKKVTKKVVPPDVAALKVYIDYAKVENEFENMSVEELEKEKKRLLEDLKK